MASLRARAVLQTCRRGISYTNVRYVQKETDPVGLLTGLQRRELLAEAAGIEDPYNLNVVKINRVSTRDSPFEVPSVCESRIIGCICQEDATAINWMWLKSGCAQRCQCGHWFKLCQRQPL